jgi:hypothetical protein
MELDMTEPRLIRPNTSGPFTPDCKLACKGTDRPVWESPAYFAKFPDGSKGLVCSCCQHALKQIEAGIADAPNIAPGIDQSGRKRWYCGSCDYDVVTLKNLKPKVVA